MPAAVKDRAKRSLAQWVELARERYGRPLFMPTISFDLVGATAGKAFQERRHVQLNAVLLQENLEEFEAQVIPHELAHLLVHHLYGFSGGHGDEWKHTMRRLGLSPERTHKMDVSNSRTVARVKGYICGCGPHEVSVTLHNKLQRRGAKATCNKCRKVLRWVGEGVGSVGSGSAYVAPSRPPAPAHRPLPPPGRPSVLQPGGRTPSEAMLRFADSLAKKHSMQVTGDVKADFELCRQFLDKWSKAPVAPRGPVLVPTVLPPPPRPPQGQEEPPTDRQLAYATSIASRKGLTIPADIVRSKRAISNWIDANR